MYRAVLTIFLSFLAGCASGPDKQAALDTDEAPVHVQTAVPQTRPEAQGPVALPQIQTEATKAQVVQRLMAANPGSHNATPINVAEPVQSFGTVMGAAPDSTWNDLMRRVTAWANPLRHSMEPYCQDGQVRKP
jgi:hypothetical protein